MVVISNEGNLPMIVQNLKGVISKWGLTEDPTLIQSVSKIILVFEQY